MVLPPQPPLRCLLMVESCRCSIARCAVPTGASPCKIRRLFLSHSLKGLNTADRCLWVLLDLRALFVTGSISFIKLTTPRVK